MKGFSLKSLESRVVDAITCICLTESKGKFLIGGIKDGHLLVYNRKKGAKKIIENCVKKHADIISIVDLELLDSKYFLIQDSRFYIRLYSAK